MRYNEDVIAIVDGVEIELTQVVFKIIFLTVLKIARHRHQTISSPTVETPQWGEQWDGLTLADLYFMYVLTPLIRSNLLARIFTL